LHKLPSRKKRRGQGREGGEFLAVDGGEEVVWVFGSHKEEQQVMVCKHVAIIDTVPFFLNSIKSL
jgi:hypothetical protein